MKYLFTISTEKVNEEGKKETGYFDVVAANVVKALDYLVGEKGVNLDDVDYVSRKKEVPVVD